MKYLLTLFLSLLSCLLVAQNVIVEHYSKNQGLLNNMVSMTEKDSDGFMWFATWYGLCRFDGEKVLTYNHYQLDHDVPPRKIQYIIDDAKGFIWINTIDHKLYLLIKRKNVLRQSMAILKGLWQMFRLLNCNGLLMTMCYYLPKIRIFFWPG